MSEPTEMSRWFLRFNPNPAPRLRLFCFPYAGGGPHMFRSWPRQLPNDIEVCTPLLPGRGSRLREAPLTRLSFVVECLTCFIGPLLNVPFAFYSHSLGALMGFELARSLRRAALREPAHLFVSGCRAPHLPGLGTPRHQLSDPELLEELRRLNGTPLEVLESPELMQLLLPLVRADFEAFETYSYVIEEPFACPISAFGGAGDPEVSPGDLKEWQRHTTSDFSLQILEGDHFFIHQHERLLLRTIDQSLSTRRPLALIRSS